MNTIISIILCYTRYIKYSKYRKFNIDFEKFKFKYTIHDYYCCFFIVNSSEFGYYDSIRLINQLIIWTRKCKHNIVYTEFDAILLFYHSIIELISKTI